MSTAIIAYNNTIHSTTKMTPFQLLNGHYLKNNPEFGTELEYAQYHKDEYEKIYANIHEKCLYDKRQLINKINTKRKPRITIPIRTTIFRKHIRRGKLNPLFRKEKVKDNTQFPVVITNRGKVHLNKIKNLFQVPLHNEPRIKHSTD